MYFVFSSLVPEHSQDTNYHFLIAMLRINKCIISKVFVAVAASVLFHSCNFLLFVVNSVQ
jgi:hypothetical protein